jgi:hypothetical protein
MKARSRLLAVLGGTLVLSLASACSSTSDGGANGSITDTAKACASVAAPAADLATRPASFEADVAPIFAKSCAFSSCHGSKGSGNHGVFLAARGSAEDAAAVKTSLLSASHALASMPYVTPGDPEHSFLLRKLDGNLCALDAQCAGGSCGKSMPEGNALLPEASRDAVRRWIAQGAK